MTTSHNSSPRREHELITGPTMQRQNYKYTYFKEANTARIAWKSNQKLPLPPRAWSAISSQD